MREGSDGRVRGRALLAGALASLIAFSALTAVVVQHRSDGLDQLAREFVHQPRHPLLQPSMEAVSLLGGQSGQVPVVVLGTVLLWRRRRRWSLALPVVMAGAGMLQLVAKWAVDRPRPNLDPWGFPSAHVLTAVVLFGYIAYVGARQGWRGLGIGAAAALVCTVAFSRMYLDAHWLSDVLGGFSIGLAYLLAVIWLLGSTAAFQKRTLIPAVMNGPPSTSTRL